VVVLGEVDLAVRGVDRRDQLQQPLLQLGGIGRERLDRRAAIERLRVELVDAERQIHRQGRHLEDAGQQALDRLRLLALQPVVGVGRFHQQIGDQRNRSFIVMTLPVLRRAGRSCQVRNGSC
jgi:hypothetical protein